MKRLIEKVEDIIKRMRWKAHFFVKGDNNDGMQQMFGFKSRKCPPQVKDMENVESELVEMTQNIKFRKSNDTYVSKNIERGHQILTKLEQSVHPSPQYWEHV